MIRPLHLSECAILLALLAVLTHTAWGQGMCGCEHRYDLLMDLYRSTNGSGWWNRAGWGTMNPCSLTWYGVTCSNGDVTSVNMQWNSLVGTLPSSWWNMSKLQTLSLYSNYGLSGTIPAEWSQLNRLQSLTLVGGALSGTLPESIATLASLTTLNLYYNSFVGSIPRSWARLTLLTSLDLGGNQLNGTLPDYLVNMTPLQSLSLSYNRFVGPLPAAWEALPLTTLSLGSSSIGGSLPDFLSRMPRLTSLDLRSCGFVGTIPQFLSALTMLNSLHLGGNKLSGTLPDFFAQMGILQALQLYSNSFSGTLPGSWGNMSTLQYLYLSSNSLSGSLPSSWGNMSGLQYLYLSSNSLSGTLPSSWGAMKQLSSLDLGNNRFIGELPAAWGTDESSLTYVSLSSNMLNSTLPESWSHMVKVWNLNLQLNSISGTLPPSWANMSAVQYLYLYSNSLSGSLPSSWDTMSALQWLYLNGNSLTGKVPASWAKMTKLQYLYLYSNCLYGALPAGLQAQHGVSICNTRVVSTRYSCGTTDWAPSCRYVSLSDTASLSPLASRSLPLTATAFGNITSLQTTSRASSFTSTGTALSSLTLSHSDGVTVSGTWASSTDSVSLNVSRSGAPMCRLGSSAAVGLVRFSLLNATQLKQVTMGTVVLLQPEADDALSTYTPNVPMNAGAAGIRCRSVARQELLQQPALGAALTFAPGLPTCCSITNVTTGGQSERLAHSRVAPPVEDVLSSSMLLVIAPPPNGWLANTALLLDATIRITFLIECGPDSHMSVAFSVPAPGAVRVLAGQVESAVTYSQIASLATVGATSASSLGRLMAVRSMVLCDADSVVGGGVVDLGITMCEAEGALEAARSAVVSNVVLIAAAAALLLALAAAWSLATHASLRESLLVLCVPSSLLPAWTAVVPSTSASAALLLGRLGDGACVGTDAVLGFVGAVVALCPFTALVAFWFVSASGVTPALACTMVTVRRERLGEMDEELHEACRWAPSRFTRVFERRWRWRSMPSNTEAAISAGTMRCALVVLLEYRVLWYAALDSLGLAVIACVAVVSGLGGESLCRAWTVVALLLMVAQLLMVAVVQPFTTLFACVHAATTLGLTCVGVLAQLVYVFVGSNSSTSGLWLVEASGVCSLAVVGVSAVKTLLDVATLLRAVQRRVTLPRARSSPRTARGLVNDDGAADVSGEWDQKLVHSPSADGVSLSWSVGNTNECGDDDKVTALQFWDKDGNARQDVRLQDDAVSDAPIDGYFLL